MYQEPIEVNVTKEDFDEMRHMAMSGIYEPYIKQTPNGPVYIPNPNFSEETNQMLCMPGCPIR